MRRIWAGINASDINFTAGRYFGSVKESEKRLPFNAGFEAVGIVAAVGEGVSGAQAFTVAASDLCSQIRGHVQGGMQAPKLSQISARVIVICVSLGIQCPVSRRPVSMAAESWRPAKRVRMRVTLAAAR